MARLMGAERVLTWSARAPGPDGVGAEMSLPASITRRSSPPMRSWLRRVVQGHGQVLDEGPKQP